MIKIRQNVTIEELKEYAKKWDTEVILRLKKGDLEGSAEASDLADDIYAQIEDRKAKKK